MSMADIKAKLLKVQEAEDIEFAIDRAKRAIAHKALISHIQAEDEAEADRCITLAFTPDEGVIIMKAVIDALQPRLVAIQEELGITADGGDTVKKGADG